MAVASKSLADILQEPSVAPLIPPLLKRHELSIGILKERTECKDGTIFFDVTDHDQVHVRFVGCHGESPLSPPAQAARDDHSVPRGPGACEYPAEA